MAEYIEDRAAGGPLERVRHQIATMRLGRSRGRAKLHKPIMLLAVLDLFGSGAILDNRVFYNQELAERFQEYFNAVKKGDDWCQPAPPFFHLRSSHFWNHRVRPQRDEAYSKLTTSGGGSRRILENIEYAYLDDDALSVFTDSVSRGIIREYILDSFFSVEERTALLEVLSEQREVADYESVLRSQAFHVKEEVRAEVRSAAFRRIVLRDYDYQCAVCGLRLVLPEMPSPIDAAHLIPWSESHDDRPRNGMALCKLHHWALDAHLIAPTEKLRWRVSPLLDARRNSERELTRFAGLPVLLPRDKESYPHPDAIRWLLRRLAH